MNDYLILKLQGAMQAWGGHTYEGLRPCELFPTRSGLRGFLGACLGISRADLKALAELGDAFQFAVRLDNAARKPFVKPQKMIDFHTVLAARTSHGGMEAHQHSIITRREYLTDACFTLVLRTLPGAAYDLETLATAIRKPHYTPCLGRRSCPLSRPPYDGRIEAPATQGLGVPRLPPGKGMVYSEEPEVSAELRVRDVPLANLPRQFGSRRIYFYEQEGGAHVSE